MQSITSPACSLMLLLSRAGCASECMVSEAGHRNCSCFRRLVLFMANKEGSLALLDMERGEQMGPAKSPWVAPKNTSAALAMSLLDADGAPAAALAGPCPLAWANNSSSAVVVPPAPVHAPITMPGADPHPRLVCFALIAHMPAFAAVFAKAQLLSRLCMCYVGPYRAFRCNQRQMQCAL